MKEHSGTSPVPYFIRRGADGKGLSGDTTCTQQVGLRNSRYLASRLLYQGEMALDDFLIVLVIDQRTPGPFILQVLGELRQRTTLLPAVLPLEIRSKGSQRIGQGERRDLPLQWRCFQGDTVVLITDVWLAGECEENGDPPAFPRGTPLTIVERTVRRAEQENGDLLLAVSTSEGSDMPLWVELPWELVAHPSEWHGEPVPSEPRRAEATVQLYGWLFVRIRGQDQPCL